MRKIWDGLGFTFAVLFLLSGCATQDHLKPPKPPECFNRPPDEKRFEAPPEYPRKYLMEDRNKDFDLTSPDATKGLGSSAASSRRGF